MASVESDEAYARRLQALEMGIRLPPDAQTPLIHDGDGQHADNPTVLNARLNELAGARLSVYAILAVNTPQVIAAFAMLPMYWSEPPYCSEDSSARWRWWVLLSAVRILLYTGSVAVLFLFRDWLVTRQSIAKRVTAIKNISDAVGLVWFVIGNMWFFSRGSSCPGAANSPVYIMGCVMIGMNYIQICLPCILALLLIPVFCCCMPCLIRVLARIQDPRMTKGATEAAIELLPLVTLQADTDGIDGSCPICLNDMVVGEEVRVLTCKHVFHRGCLDEWLRVNASCPTCRTSIFDNTDSGEQLTETTSPVHPDPPPGVGSSSNQHRMLPTSDVDEHA